MHVHVHRVRITVALPVSAPALPIPQHRVSTGLRQGWQALEAARLAARPAALARVLLRVRPRHAPLRPYGRQPHLQADPVGERCGAARRMEGGAHGLPMDRRMHDAAARQACVLSAPRSQLPTRPPVAPVALLRWHCSCGPPALLMAALSLSLSLSLSLWGPKARPRRLDTEERAPYGLRPGARPQSRPSTQPLDTGLSTQLLDTAS